MAALHKTDGSRLSTRMTDAGDVIDSPEIQFGIRPRERGEQIARHKKICRIIIGNALRRYPLLWSGFLDPTNECLSFMMDPVTDLMR